MPTLTNLNDLRTVLGRLNAERPAVLEARPDQTQYEERGGDFLRRLQLEVASRQGKARILVTGQKGVGKSSELLCYFQRAKREFGRGIYIFCDLEKEEHPERCGATGVLLTILRDCWGASKMFRNLDNHRLDSLRDEILTKLIDWLKGEYVGDRETVTFRFGGMAFPVNLGRNAKDTGLALILGKAAQHEAVLRLTAC